MLVLFLFLGLLFLAYGSSLLVQALQALSAYFKLKTLFLSIIVLGFVSSAPEFLVTVLSAYKGVHDAAIGNVIGSNIINISLVLSITALLYKCVSQKQIMRFDIPYLLFSFCLLMLLSIDQKLDQLESFILIVVFIVYLVSVFFKRKESQTQKLVVSSKLFSKFHCFKNLTVGFFLLFFGSSLVVNSTLGLIQAFNLSQRFAGIFILSLSTSLPELITALQAAHQKEKDMVLGVIIGSNVFNTLFILGSAGLIQSLQFSTSLYYDSGFMLISTLMLYLSFFVFNRLHRALAVLFILCYLIYIAFISGNLEFLLK